MPKRKNKVRMMIVVLWCVVILVGVLLTRAQPTSTGTQTGGGAVTVAPHGDSRSPEAAGGIQLNAAGGSDLQNATLPSDVISNLLK